MKALVLGSLRTDQAEVENLKSYAELFNNQSPAGLSFNYAMLDDLVVDISPESFSIFDSHNQIELSDYSLVIMRGKLRDDIDIVFTVCEYCKLNKIKYINDYSQVRSISKLAQAVNYYLMKAPFVRTIYASQANLNQLVKGQRLSYPFIYKSRLGAHGINNFLVKDAAELQAINSSGMIAQPFIKNDGDYRIVVIGDQEIVIKRIAQAGSHLNNTSQGGNAVLVGDLKPEIIAEAHRAAKNLAMEIAGVDVIIDAASGNFYILEVNSQPQLKSGAFLEEKAALIKKYLASFN